MTSSSSSSPEITAAMSTDEHLFSYKHATHEEVLEDLSSRFILNLPDEELASLERICFQVEQAHWFYEDFIREENPKFPSLPLKKFSAMLFHACPLLHQWSHDHEQAFNTFMQYKTRVPVCGAIMLNDAWDKCVLVKGWKSSSGWGFPKGKINEDEPPHSCAIREVLEETGFNLAGRVNKEDVIELSIREQKICLYIVPGIPEDFPFKTKTRKEISKIEWFRLVDLPTWKRNKTVPGKFYLISPFIGPLKAFINQHKQQTTPRKTPKSKKALPNGAHVQRSPVYHDATQESSSQSSLENSDPHTPSPLYSTAAPTKVVTAHSSLDGEALDPHFARLLSSLALSAQTGPTLKPLEAVLESSTPVPSAPGAISETDWSCSTPAVVSEDLPDDSEGEEASSQALPPQTLSSQSLQPQSLQPRTTFQSPSPLVLSPRLNGAANATEVPLSATSSTHSGSSFGSRRIATADISPYLARSGEMPSNAKRLRQLALLESVADESAKVLSSPTRHEAPYQFPPPLPPASVPPAPLYAPSPNPTLLYSSAAHDPFQVRPWTSQAFHGHGLGPGAPMRQASMSMTQNQMLSLMNGPPQASPIPMRSPISPPALMRGGAVWRPVYPHAPYGVPGVGPTLSNGPSPVFSQSSPNPALLSILNSGRS